jgi:hypothetical protein
LRSSRRSPTSTARGCESPTTRGAPEFRYHFPTGCRDDSRRGGTCRHLPQAR